MAIANSTKSVDLSGKILNLPAISGIQNGYWYYYVPVNSNNTAIGAAIKPYRWDQALPLLNSATNLTMEGSIPYIRETWEGAATTYHGSCIEWIGAGVNDITATVETDAFFFAHLGALSAVDEPYYWDRCFLAEGSAEWEFYQYHKHLPNVYEDFDNGRVVMSGGGYIVPADKSYGYIIDNAVSVMGTGYTAVLARIHTPSVGGAHNSHNDVNLPVTQNRNYLLGGILKGNSDRFHVFYISANISQWDVYIRTYVDQSASFTQEVFLGTYDLADPDFNPVTSTGTQSRYPIRASCGTAFGTRIYVPVITNNLTSGFDLKIFSFNSLDTIAGGSLEITTILSGVSERPDCHLKSVGGELYALASDITNGGAKMYRLNGASWAEEGAIVTNSNTKFIRIHGFDYNAADTKFYAMLSGTALGGGTYTGPGVYSYELTGLFNGYPHLDYDRTTNSYVTRGALSSGYLKYNQIDASLDRIATNEPSGIANGTNIITYDYTNKKFFNKKQINLGGSSYYYHGITLKDGRKVFAGRIQDNENSLGGSDFLLSLFSDGNENPQHFAWGGAGDDYLTSVYQSDDGSVWVTGYSKSELVPKKDMELHGWIRNLNDGANEIRWVSIDTDASGNIYTAGTHLNNYIVLAKYDANYNLIWQKTIDADVANDTAYALTIDGSSIYVAGRRVQDGLVIKLNTDGVVQYTKTYSNAGSEYISSICTVNKNGNTYVVSSLVNTTSNYTTFVITDVNGNIQEQSRLNNNIINKVRKNTSADGRFLFAGKSTDVNPIGRFGVAEVISTSLIKWISEITDGVAAYEAFDIDVVDNQSSGLNGRYVVCGTTGSGTDSFIMKVEEDEVAGLFTITRTWIKSIVGAKLNAITVDANKSCYAVGYTSNAGFALEDGFIVSLDTSGNTLWQNTLGHTANERLLAVTKDLYGKNIISCGWSQSHSNGTDAIVFRSSMNGFGTGAYHIEGNTSMAYYYQASALGATFDSDNISNLAAPSNVTDSITATTSSVTVANGIFSQASYDGSYGPAGLWMLFIAEVDLDHIQEHFNTSEHTGNTEHSAVVEYSEHIFNFVQIGTVGDGTADDGNIFGYDIIRLKNGANAGKVVVVAQTSGDVAATNLGISGAYDYLITEYDPATGDIEYYQVSGSLDEEVYAVTELENGKIAYTGRTAGGLAGSVVGGYDIFLGIFDPATGTSNYYTYGTGFEDKGVNVHDLGNNELAVVFASQGNIGGTNIGSEDIGIIKFNYSTNTWGTSYQTGSTTSEIFEQNGKPSAYLKDGRIAIVGHTAGIFADDSYTYGGSDIFLGIININTGEWKKYQVGSGSADFASSVHATGEKLLIAGYSHALFSDEESTAVFVEFDAMSGFGAKSTTL